jgi:hypothetical protein
MRPHKLHVRPGGWWRLRRHLHLLCGCAPLLQQCIRLLIMHWLFRQRSWGRLLWLLCRPACLLLRWPTRLLLLRQPAVCSWWWLLAAGDREQRPIAIAGRRLHSLRRRRLQ